VLLAAGASVDLTDPDDPSQTALRVAAAYGWPEIVDLLVAAGAEAQSIIEAAGSGDVSGWDLASVSDHQRACALRAAAVNERLEVIDDVLAAGTPIDVEVDGRPAMFWAKQQGRTKAAAHLAAKGARA
jgi:ankyrin repeat protein